MIETYQRFLRENYDFKRQHVLSQLQTVIGLGLLALTVTLFLSQNRIFATYSNNPTGDIQMEKLVHVELKDVPQYYPSAHMSKVAIDSNGVAYVVGYGKGTSRITFYRENTQGVLERDSFKELTGRAHHLIAQDNHILFLLTGEENTKVMKLDGSGNLTDMTSILAGGNQFVHSMVIDKGAFHFSTEKGSFRYQKGTIEDTSNLPNFTFMGSYQDKLIGYTLQDNQLRVYSLEEQPVLMVETLNIHPLAVNQTNIIGYSNLPYGHNYHSLTHNQVVAQLGDKMEVSVSEDRQNYTISELSEFTYHGKTYSFYGIDELELKQ